MGKGYILTQPNRKVKENSNTTKLIGEQNYKICEQEEQTMISSGEEVSYHTDKEIRHIINQKEEQKQSIIAEEIGSSEHMDVNIRHIVNQVEEQEQINQQNIYQGITIDNRHFEFQESAFFEEQLKLYIPTTFVDMPDQIAKAKYPFIDCEQIIKTDDSGSVNIIISVTPNEVVDELIVVVKDSMMNAFRKLNPSYIFLDDGVETIQDKSVGFFEFKSPTLSEPLFNFMFFAELNHDVVMVVFNCPYSSYLSWKPIARQIMQSLRVNPKVLGVMDNIQKKGESLYYWNTCKS